MNDDFLKRHQKRPDPHFVETLYQQIETTNNRSFFVMIHKTYGWKSALAALIAIFVLTLPFIPQARAALSSIFSFNGVEISVDSETKAFVATGNTDAVIHQDANSIIIQGEDGTMLAGVSKAEIAMEQVDVADLQAQYPDFVLPTYIPDGYTLVDEANVFDGSVVVIWENQSNETINYMWGVPEPFAMDASAELPAAILDHLPEGAILVGPDGSDSGIAFDDLPVEVQQMINDNERSQPFQTIPGVDGGQDVMLEAEADGVAVQIHATDETLDEASLRAMLP